MKSLKTSLKVATSSLLATVIMISVPMSANALTNKEETDKAKVSVCLGVQLEQDDFGLIERKRNYGEFEFGLFANETVKMNGKTVYPKNYEISREGIYAQDGCVYFDEELPAGEYYIKEIRTSVYYEYDNKHYIFDVLPPKYNGDDIQEIDVSADKFQAKLVKKKISPKVIGDTKNGIEPLANAEIAIYGENNTVVYVGTSNKAGAFLDVPMLTLGRYTIKELTAPDGYYLNTQEESFMVDGDHNSKTNGVTVDDTPVDVVICNQQIKEGATFLFGDVDNDGKVTSSDALLVLRASIKLENYKDGTLPFIAGDVDNDEVLSSNDALIILRHSVGIVTDTLAGQEHEISDFIN